MFLFLLVVAFGCSPSANDISAQEKTAVKTVEYTVCDTSPGFKIPEIIIQYNPADESGADWQKIRKAPWYVWYGVTPQAKTCRAADYLREGLQRMTGRDFQVRSSNELSKGIVMTLFRNAPEDIRSDAEVRKALAPSGKDHYSANEAFYLRSEKDRVLIVANTAEGFFNAVVELLETVDYEVLGMGPDWTYVPDYRNRKLSFAVNHGGRPSFYIRNLWATCGQFYGVGTIVEGLTDPSDETVSVSYNRWQIGTRMAGRSMPNFPGHALQGYHQAVIEYIRENKCTDGFLAPKITVGRLPNIKPSVSIGVENPPDEPASAASDERPEAAPGNKDWIWINSDSNAAATQKVFTSDGKVWKAGVDASLDLSVPFVRKIILDSMIKQASVRFEKGLGDPPDDIVIFAMDPEDGGGYDRLKSLMKYQNWYPEYLAKEGGKFGNPYILNGYKGLNQPNEMWDPEAASDMVYGLANYLLREFDKWVDSLPEAERTMPDGRSKKSLVRCSFYCYNFHDVPPNFNIDPRIRVQIAGFPKHRGHGKWEKFATQEDLARAFKIMLPLEPSGDYRIASIAFYRDGQLEGIPAGWDASAKAISDDYRNLFNSGYRAVCIETDLNFGKYGLAYYLTSKMLWNADLTAEGLDKIRDRWFRKSFGSAWREMKAYYDFMLAGNYPLNAPNTWAKAIRLIDAADRKIGMAKEPDAQKRIDDVKQFWYYYYLISSGRHRVDSDEMMEFLWKGQMSYMVAMQVPVRNLGERKDGLGVNKMVGGEISSGPAHYTHEETQAWWKKVMEYWPEIKVTGFSEGVLANGKPAKDADLNDLVSVSEFKNEIPDVPFYGNAGTSSPSKLSFVVSAGRKGEEIGFRLYWPYNPEGGRQYHAIKVPYGVDLWDPVGKKWEMIVDRTMTTQQSYEITDAKGKKFQVAEIKLPAVRPGTYRFGFDRAGDMCGVSSLGFNPATGKYDFTPGFSFNCSAGGHTQSPSYFYIPKGTKSLDFEIWDRHGGKYLTLYKGLPSSKPKVSRTLKVNELGTHTIRLEPGEDGTVASLHSNGFSFPNMYSIPTIWAKSPSALLVPRTIAEADGLTITTAE